MTNRGGGAPITDMAFAPRSRMDPPPRSLAADAYACIMVPIRLDRPNTSLWRNRPRQWRAPLGSPSPQAASDAEAVSRKARLTVHRPSACSGVKALRNTSDAKAASRQAPLAFRSLDPFRALREPHRRRRDEERPLQLRTKNWHQTNGIDCRERALEERHAIDPLRGCRGEKALDTKSPIQVRGLKAHGTSPATGILSGCAGSWSRNRLREGDEIRQGSLARRYRAERTP